MHIPDGFLNAATMAGTGVVAAGGLANAVRIAGKKMGEKQVPLMGIMAAFIFAAQMLNFPVAGGTSGHLIGAALCAILLGPWAAVIIISLVLIAQCLIFQDGGLLALGANIFNMALLGGLGSYYIYRGMQKVIGDSQRSNLIAAFTAAWCSVMLASTACALELAFSDTSPIAVVVPAMAAVHAVIGIGEGLATLAVLGLVRSARPDLLTLQRI
jgi:cobalt/nickel transport system permease protein